MPRTARILADSTCYHVISRGNNRSQVFHQHEDYQVYCRLLAKYFAKYHLRLFHYCLMPNHVHLVVQVMYSAGLSLAMHDLNMCYAMKHQQRYQHIGHVWQDRFKSLLISRDEYLLQCGGYVELNPVRAQIVGAPEQYPWSSYRHYGYGQHIPFLTIIRSTTRLALQ